MGILVTRDGELTLPCALILLGIPLLAIGKYAKDNHHHHSTSTSASLPFQYTLGILLLSLALICIVLELRGGGGGRTNGNDWKKKSAREVQEEEDYDETRLLARHYSRTEILQKINETCRHIVQQQYTKISDRDREGGAKNGSGGDRTRVTLKQKRNVIVYLNSLALQLRYHQDEANSDGNGKVEGSGGKGRTKKDKGGGDDDDDDDDDDALYLICQEAAYNTLSTFHAISKHIHDSNKGSNSGIDDEASMDNDRVHSAAVALLALTAKHQGVRKRNIHQADIYGLDLPIRIMQSSLRYTQSHDDNENDNNNGKHRSNSVAHVLRVPEETAETIAAELQRKCCLYLGALADDSAHTNIGTSTATASDATATATNSSFVSLSTVIAQEDGLEAILNAMDWFRYHSHVINWALWAIFHICYDHVPNQCLLVRLEGIQKICTVMDNVVGDWKTIQDRDDKKNGDGDNNDGDQYAVTAIRDEAKEVTRHGIAILFDLLRYDDKKGDHDHMMANNGTSVRSTAQKDFMHIRRIALNAGMHDTVKNAMIAFEDSMEIMMMGQQMLIATGYTGDIPKFDGPLVPR